jgi:hypothetical protein
MKKGESSEILLEGFFLLSSVCEAKKEKLAAIHYWLEGAFMYTHTR